MPIEWINVKLFLRNYDKMANTDLSALDKERGHFILSSIFTSQHISWRGHRRAEHPAILNGRHVLCLWLQCRYTEGFFFLPWKYDYLISVAFCGLKNVDCGCYDVIRVCHYFKFCKFILIWVHHRKQRRLRSKDFNKTYNIDVIYWRSTWAGIMTPIHLWLSSNT